MPDNDVPLLDRTSEPARAIAAITMAVSAVCGALVAFGVAITDQQAKALGFAVTAVLTAVAVVGSWWQGRATRARVVPANSIPPADQLAAPPGDVVPPEA